uniref:ARAD1D06908p n=1 Tax=Blastobotrys adeninivorans TaxID=409370 RepID=A0A060TDH9_BLAAD
MEPESFTSSSPGAESSRRSPYKLLRRTSTLVADTQNRKWKPRRESRSQNDGNETNDSSRVATVGLNIVGSASGTPRWARSNPGYLSAFTQRIKTLYEDPDFRNVLKCALAYLICSMAVYSSLTKLYGKSDNKHMVCTTSVYFHPARTAGSMMESVLFTTISLTYSFIMAFLSMLVSAIFYEHNLPYLGYTIDIIVFCAIGFGIIAFVKDRVNKPNFGTACSLSYIFLVIILTREGNVQAGLLSVSKLFQSFILVVSGAFVSAMVCFIIWPQKAVSQLKAALNEAMDIDSDLLKFISETFLNGDNISTSYFDELNTAMNANFKKLDKQLSDAKYELYLSGKSNEFGILKRMVNSSHRLSLLLGGLSTSAQIQWHLLCEDDDDDDNNSDSRSVASSIASMESVTASARNSPQPLDNASSELFSLFVRHLGPPMRSYSYTVRAILEGIPFEAAPDYPPSLGWHHKRLLADATTQYSHARERALTELYSQDVFRSTSRDFEAAANEEGVAASCGNFSYVLEAFGTELSVFVAALEEYQLLKELGSSRSYSWLKFWKSKKSGSAENEASSVAGLKHLLTGNQQRPSAVGPPTFSLKIWRSLSMLRRTDVQFGIKMGLGAALFAIPAFSYQLRPVFSTWRGEWGLITYAIIMSSSLGGTMKTVPFRILGTFLGAVIAWASWTLFPDQEYILAIIGFVLALICFRIILTWKDNNPFGRFILLTFNLTALYSYSLSVNDDNENDDDEGGLNPIVREIAFHRFVSVCMGIVWALFITVSILPNSARRKLKDVLCIQWIRMGLIWKADPLRVEGEKPSLTAASATPARIQGISGIRGGDELQRGMLQMQALLTQAPNELRLKGPFPVSDYKELLSSTQRILDAFQNMSILVSRYKEPSIRERELIEYTAEERKELSSRIFLFFYLCSSAVSLGFPLPDKLPSTEHAIDRMLAKLNDYRLRNGLVALNKKSSILANTQNGELPPLDEEDFVLFYSYILVTVTITEELAKMALAIQRLFGVIEDDVFSTA